MGWFSRLRKRYGRHHYARESAISRPTRDGNVDVVLVDGKGTYIKTLARGVKPSLATLIIKRHSS